MKIFTKIFIAFIFISQSVFAQFPETFNYQAVARNNDGSPIVNTEISIEVSIIQGNGCETSPGTCNLIWQELHFPTTNEFGLFSINIGDGQNTFAGSVATFNLIDWNDFSLGNYFVTLRVDFGNSTYINGLVDMGTVKLQAVPYSTSAKIAEDIVKTSGKLPFNVYELNDVNLTSITTNDVLSWNGTEWVNTNVASSVVLAFDDLSDITIASPATGQTVLYNGTNWTNSLMQLNLNSDVTLAGLSNNDLLKFNGTNWINSTIVVNNLSDVNITGVSNGEIFQYNGTNWVNSTLAINNLNDVIITGAASGEALVFNGTNWVNQSVGSPWTDDASYVFYNGSLNVGIGTTTPSERFHLSTSGNEGFLVTGTYNASGSVPDLGAGTRMAFYPTFSAFRAGTVDGTQWDNLSMGKYSAAFGNNNKAAGTGSFATGISNIASGSHSFVFGSRN
ncbi:MAG: hypothetical protein U9Q83_01415, partial [Bacteroidota bacterium]|nr:hypothetical protein [Bacteroidota bacterium]